MLTKTIARERKLQDKSLRDIALVTGLSKTAVSNVEQNKGSFQTALRIAKALGIKGKRLFALAKFEAVRMARAA